MWVWVWVCLCLCLRVCVCDMSQAGCNKYSRIAYLISETYSYLYTFESLKRNRTPKRKRKRKLQCTSLLGSIEGLWFVWSGSLCSMRWTKDWAKEERRKEAQRRWVPSLSGKEVKSESKSHLSWINWIIYRHYSCCKIEPSHFGTIFHRMKLESRPEASSMVSPASSGVRLASYSLYMYIYWLVQCNQPSWLCNDNQLPSLSAVPLVHSISHCLHPTGRCCHQISSPALNSNTECEFIVVNATEPEIWRKKYS